MDEINSDVYKSTMHKMIYISKLHRCIFENNISSMGIHHSQHHLLMYIASEGEVTSQKQIADRFGITPAAVARSLKTLESEGYIKRESTASDGRLNKIVITRRGRDVVERSHVLFGETDVATFSDFNAQDLENLNRYLDMMKSRLLERGSQKQNEEVIE